MERWQLKIICSAVSVVISLVCTFLPYNLSLVTCYPCRKKFSSASKNKFNSRIEVAVEDGRNSGGTGNGQTAVNSRVGSAISVEPNYSVECNGQNGASRSNSNQNLISSEGIKTCSSGEEMDEENDGNLINQKVLDLMLCFGGGVFFGTFLLHVLPEVIEILTVSLIKPRNIFYPVPELLIGAGFFMILLAEQLVSYARKLSFAKRLEKLQITTVNDSELNTKGGATSNITNLTDVHNLADVRISESQNSTTRSIVLVLALSLHHIFEGLSIGLQKHFSNVWHITLAVLCHETAICFSMGLQFFKTDKNLTKQVVAILFISAVVMPLGILIGTAIMEIGNQTDHGSWQDIVNGVLQALACGTFVYVTFFEIFYEQIGEGKTTFLKIIFVLIGFTFMALLGLLPEEDVEIGRNNGAGSAIVTTIGSRSLND